MKKIAKLFLTLILLPLVSCGNDPSPTPDPPGPEPEPTPEKTVSVKFFLDYSQYDEFNPYYSYMWYEGEVLPDIPIPEPEEAPDSAFPTFAGWSINTIVDDLDQLWDEENDVTPVEEFILYLFGIWTAEEEQPQPEPEPEEERIVYLNPSVWDVDNAYFAAWTWSNNTDGCFTKLTQGNNGLYFGQYPEGHTNILFVRCNPGYSEPEWNTEIENNHIWNKTDDLTLPKDAKIKYTITGWGTEGGNSTGEWGTK